MVRSPKDAADASERVWGFFPFGFAGMPQLFLELWSAVARFFFFLFCFFLFCFCPRDARRDAAEDARGNEKDSFFFAIFLFFSLSLSKRCRDNGKPTFQRGLLICGRFFSDK